MLLAGAHEAPDSDHRRVHDTQLAVAGQESAAAQQERHGSSYINAKPRAPRYLVAGGSRVKPFTLLRYGRASVHICRLVHFSGLFSLV